MCGGAGVHEADAAAQEVDFSLLTLWIIIGVGAPLSHPSCRHRTWDAARSSGWRSFFYIFYTFSFPFFLFPTLPRLPLIQLTLEINRAIIAHLHLYFASRSFAPNPRLCVPPCASVFGLYRELVGLFFFLSLPPLQPLPMLDALCLSNVLAS